MEQILTANNNAVDAVLSENDGMAGALLLRWQRRA
jgi:D-xylose transport system substrate-binding protein